MKFLLGDGNVVEHGLHVAWLCQHVIVYLVEERGDADILRPLPRVSRCEPDARAQHDALFQILDTVGRNSRQGQSTLQDDLRGQGLGSDQAAHIVERLGELRHRRECGVAAQATAEEADCHVPRLVAAAHVLQRAYDVTRLKDAAGPDAAVRPATETMVAQVIGQDVVSGIMEDLVVRDEVDLEAVPAGRPLRVPRLELRGQPGPVEPHRVIGDDQLVGPGWDEPALQRDAVEGRKGDVLVVEVLLNWLNQVPSSVPVLQETRESTALVISWAIFGPAVQWSRGEQTRSAEEMAHHVLTIVVAGLSPVIAIP